jgi:3-dehydrosphinganine reductase
MSREKDGPTMFNGKHVVITGGSSGLGLELARRLVDQGARVTLMARNQAKLDQAVAELVRRRPGAQVSALSVDVSSEEDARTAMGRAADADGGIDILVNSAGILREGHFEQIPLQEFRDVMDVNYFGVLNATRAALPYLKASRGRLVNIASMAGLVGVFGYTPYCSAKHALVGLSETLRYELTPMGVTVHLVCPGEFDSPMVDALELTRTPENRAHTLTIPKASLEVVAKDTLAGVQSGKFLIIPGFPARATSHAIRLLPGVVRALGDRTVARARRTA